MYSQGRKPLLRGIMGCFAISSNSVIFNLGDLLKNTVLSPEILTQVGQRRGPGICVLFQRSISGNSEVPPGWRVRCWKLAIGLFIPGWRANMRAGSQPSSGLWSRQAHPAVTTLRTGRSAVNINCWIEFRASLVQINDGFNGKRSWTFSSIEREIPTLTACVSAF